MRRDLPSAHSGQVPASSIHAGRATHRPPRPGPGKALGPLMIRGRGIDAARSPGPCERPGVAQRANDAGEPVPGSVFPGRVRRGTPSGLRPTRCLRDGRCYVFLEVADDPLERAEPDHGAFLASSHKGDGTDCHRKSPESSVWQRSFSSPSRIALRGENHMDQPLTSGLAENRAALRRNNTRSQNRSLGILRLPAPIKSAHASFERQQIRASSGQDPHTGS